MQGWETQSPQVGSGLLKHYPSSPSLPTLPYPILTPQRHFSNEPFLRKVKGLEVCLSVQSQPQWLPYSLKEESPGCQGNLDFRLRRHLRVLDCSPTVL